MRQKLVYMIVGIALVLGMFALPPAPAAKAGNNGQQLVFQRSSDSKSIGISRIIIRGKIYNGKDATWYREFNPPFTGEYYLTNYWWKENVFIEFSVRSPNGSNWYGNCWVYVPPVMSGNWVRVYLDRGATHTCGT